MASGVPLTKRFTMNASESYGEVPPNKSMNRTFYSGPTYGGFAILTSGRATVKRRLSKR